MGAERSSGPEGGRRRAGRPPSREVAARDAALLDTAEDLFIEHGYQRVSIDQIARAASATARTIYARFGGKLGLLAAVLERRSTRESNVLQSLPVERDVRCTLETLARYFLVTASCTSGRLLSADAVASRQCGASGLLEQARFAAWHARLEEVFASASWRVRFPVPSDPGVLADLFAGCVLSRQATGDTGQEPSGEAAGKLATAATRRFFDALARP